MVDAAEALLGQGRSVEEIAELVEREPVQIRASLSSRNHAKTPRTIVMPMDLYGQLARAALARGIAAPELALQLLRTIADDDAFDALLGESAGPCQDQGGPHA